MAGFPMFVLLKVWPGVAGVILVKLFRQNERRSRKGNVFCFFPPSVQMSVFNISSNFMFLRTTAPSEDTVTNGIVEVGKAPFLPVCVCHAAAVLKELIKSA